MAGYLNVITSLRLYVSVIKENKQVAVESTKKQRDGKHACPGGVGPGRIFCRYSNLKTASVLDSMQNQVL